MQDQTKKDDGRVDWHYANDNSSSRSL